MRSNRQVGTSVSRGWVLASVGLLAVGAVVLLAAGVGAFAWWRDKQATERERATEQVRQSANEHLTRAADLRKRFRFKEAAAALALTTSRSALAIAESRTRFAAPAPIFRRCSISAFRAGFSTNGST